MLFTKMQGLGNNYLFFNQLDTNEEERNWQELSKAVSDVHFGVGSDGIILMCSSALADFKMRIFNADGSEGNTCGNGLRCMGKYLFDNGYVNSEWFTVETAGGIVRVQVQHSHQQAGQASLITVDMGKPRLLREEIPMRGDSKSSAILEEYLLDGEVYQLTCLSMGNPHAINFVDDVWRFPLHHWGPKLEQADLFPDRVNAGIVHVRNDSEIDYRVWERGSGLTMACGSGACAAVVACVLTGKLEAGIPVKVHLPGGELQISWNKNGHVHMTGRAGYICSGQLMMASDQHYMKHDHREEQ